MRVKRRESFAITFRDSICVADDNRNQVIHRLFDLLFRMRVT